jgi:hypothetical protein
MISFASLAVERLDAPKPRCETRISVRPNLLPGQNPEIGKAASGDLLVGQGGRGARLQQP